MVSYPSSYSAPNVVAVAATDANDALASFSNYGAASVDLAAPGVNILSTTRNNTYAFYSGTSMATPHVSGAAALLLSVCPLDTAGVKSAILNNVDLAGSLAGRVLTSGRLNVDAAIRACVNTPPPPPPPPTVPAAPSITGVTAGNAQVVLTWTVPSGATSFTVKRGTVSGSYVTLASGAAASTYTDTAVTNGTKYYYVVSAVNAAGSSPNSAEVSATPAGVPAAPTGLTATSTVTKQVSLKWTASAGATSYIVKRSTSSGGSYSTVASKVLTTSYTATGVSSGRKYNYVVIAVNAAGSSANSAQVNVTVK